MAWPIDEARHALISSILTFKEICGDEATIRFLEDELIRENVIKERARTTHSHYQAANAAAQPSPAVDDLVKTVDGLVEALEFYARADGYGTGPGNHNQLPVEMDRGFKARQALASVKRLVRNEVGQ